MYSKLITFLQAYYTEGGNNHNRKDDIVETSSSKIYTTGENKLERIKKRCGEYAYGKYYILVGKTLSGKMEEKYTRRRNIKSFEVKK